MRLLVILVFFFLSIATGNTKTVSNDSVNYYLTLSKEQLEKNNRDLSTAYLQKAQLLLEKSKNDSYKENLKLRNAISKSERANKRINATSKLINILAVALVSILSLLSISLYKNNLFRIKSNQLLLEKNKELELAKEKAEKASKARSEFLSTVSHELRTPLNAINGITHLLIEENPKDSQVNYLNSLQFSGNYLLHFINDILEINRIDSENVPIERINNDLKAQLENIQKSFKEIAEANNNTFILDIDESIPTSMIYDPTKLAQIFLNLVNNSLKFTRNGFVKLSARLGEVKDNQLTINFKIADNGIGIPDDKQETIFDSFSQGSIEINRKYGGTGLGLAIVKKLIELLGGNIYLNSKVGLGTTFSFELPFEISDETPIIKPVIEYDESKLNAKKILLVEDNKINQMITKKMLENKGIYCDIVDNGEAAIESLQNEHSYDLVLMDVHLPGINGTVATQRIREFNNLTPIIALTAISLNENREMLLSFGMTDVITKPFEPVRFYKTISEYIS